MKKIVMSIALATLAAGFSGYTSAANVRGVVDEVDDEANMVIIDGETYTFGINFAGLKPSEIVCKGCRVAYQLNVGAISSIINNPVMTAEEEANYVEDDER